MGLLELFGAEYFLKTSPQLRVLASGPDATQRLGRNIFSFEIFNQLYVHSHPLNFLHAHQFKASIVLQEKAETPRSQIPLRSATEPLVSFLLFLYLQHSIYYAPVLVLFGIYKFGSP